MRRAIGALLAIFALCGATVSAYCPDFMRNQTTCSCAEYIDGAVIRCSGPNGPMIVEKLKNSQTDIHELTLENANIIEVGERLESRLATYRHRFKLQIGSHAFRNLRIKKLVLDNNRIKTIQRDAFAGLETVLQELSIANNNLPAIPSEALEGLHSLNILSLRCNQIGNLSGEFRVQKLA